MRKKRTTFFIVIVHEDVYDYCIPFCLFFAFVVIGIVFLVVVVVFALVRVFCESIYIINECFVAIIPIAKTGCELTSKMGEGLKRCFVRKQFLAYSPCIFTHINNNYLVLFLLFFICFFF